MKVFLNNEIIDERDAKISVGSNGFQFGIGFFTTLKCSNGVCHFLGEHINRLKYSLKSYDIALPNISYRNIIDQLMKKNEVLSARVKIIHFLDINNKTGTLIEPNILVENRTPQILKVQNIFRGNNELYKHKSLNFFENVFYRQKAKNQNINDFIFLDYKSNILETCYSNIFFIKENVIITPPDKLPLLNGIIRQQIIQHNPKNFRVIEKEIKIDEIGKFSACFLTNSINTIVPVKQILFNQEILSYSINEVLDFHNNNNVFL